MKILYFFESIRTPFLDTLFSTVTHLGEEMLFIVLGLIFFWCVNKTEGYYLLSVGLIGTILNQFLKLLFRIPRPWIKDPNFTIVESARAEATGYSFPSGHTQAAVGSYGCIARFNKNKFFRIICIIFCFLVPISRMYLGVHTPLDVSVSIIIASALIFGLYPLIKKSEENPKILRIIFAVTTALGMGFLIFAQTFPFPENIDKLNLESGIENSYKLLGCMIGLWLSFEIDTKFIHFETKASLPIQILKLLLGIIPILAIKILLKEPLIFIFQNKFIADLVRYFLIAAFAGCVWPLTFKFFRKLK